MMQRTTSGRVVGFGDPVLDVVSSVDFQTLENLELHAGGCTSIPRSELERLLSLQEIKTDIIKYVITYPIHANKHFNLTTPFPVH